VTFQGIKQLPLSGRIEFTSQFRQSLLQNSQRPRAIEQLLGSQRGGSFLSVSAFGVENIQRKMNPTIPPTLGACAMPFVVQVVALASQEVGTESALILVHLTKP
jgi:hypothetical protein